MIKGWCYWLLLPHSLRETVYLQPFCWKPHNKPFVLCCLSPVSGRADCPIMLCSSPATLSDWLPTAQRLAFFHNAVCDNTFQSWHVVPFYTANISVLLCGWPYISRPLFHSYFLSFFFVYSFPWLTEGIFGKPAIFDLISTSFETLLLILSTLLPLTLFIPPSFHSSVAVLSSFGWWSKQCSHQTWAECF